MFRKVLTNIEEIIASILLTTIFALVLIEVGQRYFTGGSIVWVAEVTQVMFVWSVFVGAGAAVKRGSLISIDILYAVVPIRVRALLNLAILTVLLAVVGILGYQGFKFMLSFAQSTMPLSGLPSWYLYAAVPVGAVIIIIRSIQVYGSMIINSFTTKETERTEDTQQDTQSERTAEYDV